MKRFIFTIIISLLILFTAIPISVSAEEGFTNYPKSIAGYPVIFVGNSNNSYDLSDNEIILYVLDNNQKVEHNTTPVMLAMEKIAEYLNYYKLPENWSISIYGGHNATKERFLIDHQIIDSKLRQTAKTYINAAFLSGLHTYSTVINVDPLDSANTITYQSVWWEAPEVGYEQDNWSALLLNGYTNTNSFIQSGQKFQSTGGGLNVWTDTPHGLSAQYYTVTYVASHHYKFALNNISGIWYAVCEDLTAGIYQAVSSTITGTHLIYDEDTSVFFENANTNSSWWGAFYPDTIYVNWANEKLNGVIAPWGQDTKYVTDSSGQYVPNGSPPNEIVGGSLANYNSAHWHLFRVPYVE
jgi:hypothetical protein